MVKNYMVSKGNVLIQASYALTTWEKKLILLAIVLGRDTGRGFTIDSPLVVHADAYAEAFKVTKNEAYKVLLKASESLYERGFTYTSHDGTVEKINKGRWVQHIAYVKGGATIELVFSDILRPLISRLEAQFTSYMLHDVAELKNIYSIRLYELLVQWKSTKTFSVRIAELRSMLGIADSKYKQVGAFKLRVIDKAIEDINAHTNIKVWYKPTMRGRLLLGFVFSFTFQQSSSTTPPKLTPRQRGLFADKLAHLSSMTSLANVGESTEQFAERLFDLLGDSTFVATHLETLKSVGFSE